MELDENLRYHGTDEDSPTNDNQSPSSELNPDKQSPSIVVPKKYDMALCFEVPQRNVLKLVKPSNSPIKTPDITPRHQNDANTNKSTYYSSLVDSSIIGKRIGLKRRGKDFKNDI